MTSLQLPSCSSSTNPSELLRAHSWLCTGVLGELTLLLLCCAATTTPRFDLWCKWDEEEAAHWLLPRKDVVSSYVVEVGGDKTTQCLRSVGAVPDNDRVCLHTTCALFSAGP